MKRNKLLVLFVLLLNVAGVMKGYAQTFTVGNLNYSINSDGVSVTVTGHVNGSSATGELVIPGTVIYQGSSYSVTSIGDYAFYKCIGFTGSLTIPNSVTEIGNYAFQDCTGFTGDLTIPNSVTSIGEGAFYYCSEFNGSLTISNSVTSISDKAFQACYKLTGSLDIPNSVTSIGISAFEDCYGFNGSLTIPNSVTSIGNRAFYNCYGFEGSLTIPNSVTSIGSKAFYECYGFDGSLTISNSVESIGNSVFYYCYSLTGDLTIPNSVTSIDQYAFNNCKGLTGNLTIPNSVTSIGQGAFSDCSGFTGNLTIPNSVTTIGKNAFSGCSGFNGSLTIGDSVESIGERAFSGCSSLTGNLTIPNSVTLIDLRAFYNCSGFTGSLTIPNSVTSIGQYAFNGCTGFDGSLTIGNSVATISKYAFQDCSGFKHVTIGNSVTKIDSYAFRRCSNLASVTLLCTTPPTLVASAFSNTSCQIYVPYEFLSNYKSSWSSYSSRIFPWLQKSITGYGTSTESDKWVFIASPVATVGGIAPVAVDNLIGSLIPESTLYDYDLYRFNQSADLEWENYNNPDHTEGFMLVNGQGYLYASKEDVNLVFKGTFNEDETKDVELVYDAGKPLAGWNLVGNPFPVTATVTGRSYYVMNEAGTGINPEAVSAGGTIAACTGIVVKAEENETDPQVTFTRTTQQSAANQGTLQIAVAQNNIRSNAIQDNAIVSFNEGDQLAKFYFGEQNANIYIPQGAEEYAIATSNGQGDMPLNFKAKEDGQYTISVNPENVEMNYLHLIDNSTGADIDLLATPSYTFNAKTTDYESRFRLVFSAIGNENGGNENAPFAFVSNGQIIITGIDGDACNASLQMVDVMGHVLVCRDAIIASPISTTGMASGVYVLRLVCGDNVRTQKMVIQ